MRENLYELLDVIRLNYSVGIGEFYMQCFVYFDTRLGVEEQSLYHGLQAEERELITQVALCAELGLAFQAAGATTPLGMMAAETLAERLWSAVSGNLRASVRAGRRILRVTSKYLR